MCGVNFIYKKRLGQKELKAAIDRMNQITKHRGPDKTSAVVGENFAAGFNRLEIVGGKAGFQPIFNEDKTIILIGNGEIFNYKKLIAEELSDHKFNTTSDIEVILHLYEKYKKNLVLYLEGQFSFVIYDIKNNKIFFGRDKFGIIPLFYFEKNGLFIISSEIKGLIASSLIKNVSLDLKGISELWFFYGPIPPKTCFYDIRQLPPASIGTYDVKKSKVITKKYYNFGEKCNYINYPSADKKLYRLLKDSVNKRLQGDFIPGVYISGGIDSSAIAYLVNSICSNKIKLFGISFFDKRYDELKFQQILAKSLNCGLEIVKINIVDIKNGLTNCIFHTESPLTRLAPVPMMLLSERVRDCGIKFVLCGEGADELFLGYPVFLKNKVSFQDKWEDNKKILEYFRKQSIGKYIENKFQRFNKNNGLNKLDFLRKKEIDSKLSQYLLTNQGDRTALAFGIEQRFPFLDDSIVKFAKSLNKKDLIDDGQGKSVLRKCFRNLLPPQIVNRKKQGYLAPDENVILSILSDNWFLPFLSKATTDKVKVFKYNKVRDLINRISIREYKDIDIKKIIFILTTHILYNKFIKKVN